MENVFPQNMQPISPKSFLYEVATFSLLVTRVNKYSNNIWFSASGKPKKQPFYNRIYSEFTNHLDLIIRVWLGGLYPKYHIFIGTDEKIEYVSPF